MSHPSILIRHSIEGWPMMKRVPVSYIDVCNGGDDRVSVCLFQSKSVQFCRIALFSKYRYKMKYSNDLDFLKIYLYAEQESNNSAVN